MKPLFSRALACLVSVSSLLGLGIAVAPVAQASACGGLVSTSGPVGSGADIGVYAGAAYASICFDAAGVRHVISVSNVRVVDVHETFLCANPVGGSVGDPNEPPYVEYRVGFDSQPYGSSSDPWDYVAVCVGVGASMRTVVLRSEERPQIGSYTPGAHPDPSCGYGVREDVEVYGENFDLPAQRVLVGAGGDSPGRVDYVCIGARGFVECELSESVSVSDPVRCPTGAALVAEINARVAEAVQNTEDAIDDAEDAVGDARDDVDAAVAEVRRIVDPIVAAALAEVARAVDTVEDLLPVRIEPTMGDCSVSVTSLSSPAIEVRRSPTGQVPASVCVVTATSVTRVTIG